LPGQNDFVSKADLFNREFFCLFGEQELFHIEK